MSFNPSRFTPPRRDDFVADIDWLLPALRHAWAVTTPGFEFDDWQIELMRRVTELDADGSLRWRSVLISMGRQNGKTELVAALGVWSLLRGPNLYNVGLASTAEQAGLVYRRLQNVIAANPALAARMAKLTDTRGIHTTDGSRYEIKASKSASLQGVPIATAVLDECHLIDDAVWSAAQSGQGARPNTILIGITTAGDQDSALLTRLYDQAEKAINGDPKYDRFGAFIWESSSALVPDSDDELLELLVEANPALTTGRIDSSIMVADVRTLPDDEIIRYRLNRFVNSSANSFIPSELWQKAERPLESVFPTGDYVFSIDRTPGYEYATVSVAVKDGDDVIWTELVASIVKPSLERLVEVAIQIYQAHSPRAIIVDGYTLRDLANELKRRGVPVEVATLADIVNASSILYARLARRSLLHAGDPLLSIQVPRAVRRLVGDSFRISRRDSSTEIDAVVSTALAVYGAETLQRQELQIW